MALGMIPASSASFSMTWWEREQAEIGTEFTKAVRALNEAAAIARKAAIKSREFEKMMGRMERVEWTKIGKNNWAGAPSLTTKNVNTECTDGTDALNASSVPLRKYTKTQS